MKMACVENMTPNVDSEMEEGEIVDDLSDISSEEEYLLRERLAVLENYNNVLERKKAKCSVGAGTRHKKDLSDISSTHIEHYYLPLKNAKLQKYPKIHHRQKRKKDDINIYEKYREHKKKNIRPKKRLEVKVIPESSEESEDDYKHQRKKLAEAVVVNKMKNDKTSLSERLQKMLCGVNPEPMKFLIEENKTDTLIDSKIESLPIHSPEPALNTTDNVIEIQEALPDCQDSIVINICSDEEQKTITPLSSLDTVDSNLDNNQHLKNEQRLLHTANSDKDSDDDLELLRQHALKTKPVNTRKVHNVPLASENKIVSEDEDSDTTELRLICLKSALIKKAIEMKRKQKLQKRLSQSSNIHDDSLEHAMLVDKIDSDNNTDIESVDMDIGSDGEDKLKENGSEFLKDNKHGIDTNDKHIPVLMVTKEDELEEDEDLLRAKLLTSLSKNLPNLVDPSVAKTNEPVLNVESVLPKQPQPCILPGEKRFIINLESDSEEENEATKNLTKMHMKLSDQKDFQVKLDMFLKSTRMEVENTALPDVVQQPIVQPPKKNEKYVAKAVKHLPKSEQMEYKYLVKRMAELEKLKQARQSTIGLIKDTSKPKSTAINASHLSLINNLEEKIKMSRKSIAEESAKMLKLKEEGTKLSQKFKIVATELRNIKTALALNKKQQRSVQNFLTKIRQHHQMLLKSSLTSTHSKVNAIQHLNNIVPSLKKQNTTKVLPLTIPLPKEPSKENIVNPVSNMSATTDVTKHLKQIATKISTPMMQPPRLSIEVDVANNKKVVTMSVDTAKCDSNNDNENEGIFENKRLSSPPVVEKEGGIHRNSNHQRRCSDDDYISPLDAFGSTTWREDPNAILCPFEVCGDCKDADCKYLHTNTTSK